MARRIKAGEKEEEALRAKVAERNKTLAKLEKELARVTEGEDEPGLNRWRSKGKGVRGQAGACRWFGWQAEKDLAGVTNE